MTDDPIRGPEYDPANPELEHVQKLAADLRKQFAWVDRVDFSIPQVPGAIGLQVQLSPALWVGLGVMHGDEPTRAQHQGLLEKFIDEYKPTGFAISLKVLT